MDSANMLAKKHTQTFPNDMRPSAKTTNVKRWDDCSDPLCTETFPTKHLDRGLALKTVPMGLTAFMEHSIKLNHSPVSHSRSNRWLWKHSFKSVEKLD